MTPVPCGQPVRLGSKTARVLKPSGDGQVHLTDDGRLILRTVSLDPVSVIRYHLEVMEEIPTDRKEG